MPSMEQKLFRRSGRAVSQALRIAARKNELNRGEKPFVEDFFLIGDQLPNAVGDFNRTTLQLNHSNGQCR